MLHKTRGIVLSYIRFRETSIIAKVYTEVFGIQSYVVSGVRSSKSKANRIALFQPLTLLDMVVYHKSKTDTLHRLSEVRNLHPFGQLPFDMVKTSLALFMAEVMGKCLREEEPNEPLFDFLERSVTGLDEAKEGLESYHLFFMRYLAGYLGFGIGSADEFVGILREYRYSALPSGTQRSALEYLVAGDQEGLKNAGKSARAALLLQLLFYYRTHLENFGEMKSLDVLKEVMRSYQL